MKKLLFICALLTSCITLKQNVNNDIIVHCDDTFCYDNQNKLANGISYTYHNNGNVAVTKNYKNGKLDGEIFQYYENGSLENVSIYANGNFIESNEYSENGVIKSKLIQLDDVTQKIIIYYENGNIESILHQKELWKNGKFKNLLIVGKATHYFKNGNIEIEANYKNGVLDGEEIYYYENGSIKEKYNNKSKCYEKKDDEYCNVKKYDTFNELSSESNFINGKLVEEISYYENGKIKSKSVTKNNNIITSEYFLNNKLKMTYTSSIEYGYKKNGTQKSYDIKGKLLAEANFDNGKINGIATLYDIKGNVVIKFFYNNNLIEDYKKYENGVVICTKNTCNENIDFVSELTKETVKRMKNWTKEEISMYFAK